ncbi:MAG: phosphoglucosamine mutase [Fibrobacterota bacterium]
MPLSKLMVSVSGVRGIVGDTLTPEVLIRFSSAFAQYCHYGTVVIGRDSRVTGEIMFCAVATGLLASGCRVIDLGICSTPSIQLMARELCADGGIALTASHNGVEWNAMKFIGSNGLFLTREKFDHFLPMFKKGVFERVQWDRVRKIEREVSANRVYLDRLLSLPYLDIPRLQKRRFRVALDCVNGAGGVICPHLLRELGCEVVEINCEPNGLFPHAPEPIPENLGQLCKAVKETGADVGFAVDPDVDRLAVVSDKAVAIGEEYTLAIAGDFLLRRKKGLVVVNLSTSRMIEDIAEKHGSRVLRTPVGEINVSSELLKQGGIFGGEGNGGVMLPEIHPCRDAVVGMELILQCMLETGKSISEIVKTLPKYFIKKVKVDISRLDVEKGLARFKKTFADGRIDAQDGLRVDFKNSWVQLRKSNTEPIVRIIAEAASQAEVDRLCARAAKCLK